MFKVGHSLTKGSSKTKALEKTKARRKRKARTMNELGETEWGKSGLEATGPGTFQLGTIVGTPGALAELEKAGVLPQQLLARHTSGDWGDVGTEDHAANDEAALTGERLLSSYRLPTGVRVWVLTEWDRSATTVLLPGEY